MKVWVLALLAAGSAVAAPGGLGGLDASKRMDALNGRLSLGVPASTVDEARSRGIMAAPESAELETRLVASAGRERLVVMVHELFATAPSDLFAAVKIDLADLQEAETDDVAPLTLEDPRLRGVETKPRKPELEEDAAEVDSAFYALPDNTVVRVAVYVNQTALGQLEAARGLAKKILSSARAGSKPLSRGGRRKIGELSITLPADAALSSMRGPDFEVYRVHWFAPFGDQDRTELGIYVGSHPGLMSKQRETPVKTVPVDGSLFGRKVTWQGWTDGEEKVVEVIEPISREKPQLLVHAFATGTAKADLGPARRVAESITSP